MICSLCLIEHANSTEAREIHEASARVREQLRARMQLVMNPTPIVPGARKQAVNVEAPPWPAKKSGQEPMHLRTP